MRFVFTPHVYTLMGLHTRGGVEALNSSLCTPTHPPSKIGESVSLPWEYGRMRAGCSPPCILAVVVELSRTNHEVLQQFAASKFQRT